jgi:hypothetical protein
MNEQEREIKRLGIMQAIRRGIVATMYKTITVEHRGVTYGVKLLRHDIEFGVETHLTVAAADRLKAAVERFVAGEIDRAEVKRIFQSDFVPAHAVHYRDNKPVYEPTAEEFERMKATFDLKDGERVHPETDTTTEATRPRESKQAKTLDGAKRTKRQRNRDNV